ncbi:uncharacterized protein PAC_03403 [Phialocephala subalpina]|uniref:Carbonic anhydrase n=1 Tax=Phialocephala subalpina TaxID=576137 RepID=A0A1L7WL89_9HELO|nr:uncharacterized protein PAC_03403 [Phialocephala subalpina]
MSRERVEEFVARNAKYAETHKPSPHLAHIRHIVQARGGTVILTCSDPRITPEEFFDLHCLEASVIRNAGGRSVDSMRTLQALDTIGNVF